MTSATIMREQLAAARRRGEPFEEAWASALDVVLADCAERARWREALVETRAAWRAGWERRPPPAAERALTMLAA